MSPSSRHPEKKPLKFYISQELHCKFKRLADARGCSMTDLLLQFVIRETRKIQLTAEDYENIAAQLRKNNKY